MNKEKLGVLLLECVVQKEHQNSILCTPSGVCKYLSLRILSKKKAGMWDKNQDLHPS